MISGFSCQVDENCLFWVVMQQVVVIGLLFFYHCTGFLCSVTTAHCVITQNSAVLIYFVLED
jgi:hypothetical protein